ncbi:MAG: Poly(A) polymerase I precursor [Syntrophorhabdus sp. PtaU1.Bin153]|nr:MAG: Poly(A) polymerase I precursor [Syntrophorhabdus sp. PtaU1.Bin153]
MAVLLELDGLLGAIRKQKIVQEISRYTFAGKAFLVGGAIRELLLKKTPKDYDFALTRQEDLQILEKAFGGSAFLLGKKPIQTYRIVTPDVSVDVTFLKGTIEDDLGRRDFTMNAIAYDVDRQEIIDCLGGIDDIRKRIIRYPKRTALVDDPLRMLKATRHFATLEGFSMDMELVRAIQEFKTMIHEVAPERIKYETDQIIVSDRAFEGIKMMERTGLLFELFPDLFSLRKLDQEKGFVLETYGHTMEGFRYITRWGRFYGLDDRGMRNTGYALLFHDLGKAHTYSRDDIKNVIHFFYHEKVSSDLATKIMDGLRFSSLDVRTVVKLIENHMRVFLISGNESTEKATRRLVYKMRDLTPSLLVLTMCDMYGSSGGSDNESTVQVRKRCDEVLDAYEEWRREPLPRLITGHDLLTLGLAQGPSIGKVLEDIREKQISGEFTGREEALTYAKNQVATLLSS